MTTKYNTHIPKPSQYILSYGTNARSLYPISVSENLGYLRSKMHTHRNEMGAAKTGIYTITDHDDVLIYTHTFDVGELGKTKKKPTPAEPKTTIKYRKVYLYEPAVEISEKVHENERPVAQYDAVCDENGAVVTDLKLLKKLLDMRFRNQLPIMIISNKCLVSIATYLPQDRDSFVRMPGAGEKLYERYGEMFIRLVKRYLSEEKK